MKNITAIRIIVKNCSAILILVLIIIITSSCRKEFLNEKPSSSLVIPTTLDDFQKLLDYATVMLSVPELGEISSDDFYLSDSYFKSISLNSQKNAYIWAKDIYEGQGNDGNYNRIYEQVFYANTILNNIDKIAVDSINRGEWNRIKGSAYFSRAFAFFLAAQLWAPPYDQVTAKTDLGIPLRLETDINLQSVRSTVEETFLQIINDLEEAGNLLNNSVDFNNPNRPSRASVFALLARMYLMMQNYNDALVFSNKCLEIHSKLINYNTISQTAVTPFNMLNEEVILQRRINVGYSLFSGNNLNIMIDSVLYSSYSNSDLRKTIYFRLNSMGRPIRKRDYQGTSVLFGGIATDEVLLTRAECYARIGDTAKAIADLNRLLENRWIAGTYNAQQFSSVEDVLTHILLERRKELVLRGIRWFDLRRLNKEGANISLRRIVEGVEYTLPANDVRWTLPFPPDVISLSAMPQNER